MKKFSSKTTRFPKLKGSDVVCSKCGANETEKKELPTFQGSKKRFAFYCAKCGHRKL